MLQETEIEIQKPAVRKVFRTVEEAQQFEKELFGRLYPENVDQAALEKRPFWTGHNTDQIGVWFRLMKISEVNSEDQTLTAKVMLILLWLDVDWADQIFADQQLLREKQSDHESLGMASKMIGVKFRKIHERGNTTCITLEDPENCPSLPKYRIDNLVDEIELIFQSVKVFKDGCIRWQKYFKMTIEDPVVATNFPFDYQDFTIDFRLMEAEPPRYFCIYALSEYLKHYRPLSDNYDIRSRDKNVIDKFYSRSWLATTSLAIPEWEVCSLFGRLAVGFENEVNTNVTPFALKSNLNDGWNAQYTCYFVLKRRSAYWLVHVWSLYSMFVMVSMVSFSLDAQEDMASRQQICLSLIFVLVALKFTVSSELPKLPYLTILDYKVYISMVLLLVLMISQSILPVLTNHDDTLAHKDSVMFYCFTLGILLIDVVFFCRGKYVQRTERRELERLANEMCQYPSLENISIVNVD